MKIINTYIVEVHHSEVAWHLPDVECIKVLETEDGKFYKESKGAIYKMADTEAVMYILKSEINKVR